jgi:hypothetical protein
MIEYASNQSIAALYGSVLQENDAMLGLAHKLGFVIEPDPDDSATVMVKLQLF